MLGSGNNNVPAAYLNYILFDQDMVYKQSGFKQISGAANMSSEYVSFDNDIVIPEAGFIYCFVSFENTTGRVFWDDFKVTHVEHPVIQTDDYYPFGLAHGNGYQRVTAKKNRYLYNGKEKIEDLGIDWYYYGARMYMSDIGRWSAVDPLAQLYISTSPYTYVLNQPTQAVDPNGMACAGCNDKDDWRPSYVGEEKPDKPDYFPRLDNAQKISESNKSSSEEHDYELDENGNTVKVKDTEDKFDRLLDEDGNVIAQVNQGLLKEGQNLMDEFNLIVVGSADDQKSYTSFLLKLSQFEGFADGRGAREILAFFTKSSNGIDDILITPFKGNTRTSSIYSVGQFLIKGKYSNNGVYTLGSETYKLTHWIHTHPGRAGATSMGNWKPSTDDINITTNTFKIPGLIFSRFGNSRINVDGTYKKID